MKSRRRTVTLRSEVKHDASLKVYQTSAAMSALGQKQTCTAHKLMSALAPIATAIADSVKGHVCFTPESGHVQCTRPCLLWARSGHLLLDYFISEREHGRRHGETNCDF